MAKVRGGDVVRRNLSAYDVRFKATVATVLMQEAAVVEQRMKAEAPWQDRTGNARRELHAGVLEDGQRFTLRARHGVPYGIHLETAHQGRYQILQPVLRSQWPTTLKRVAAAVKEVKAT